MCGLLFYWKYYLVLCGLVLNQQYQLCKYRLFISCYCYTCNDLEIVYSLCALNLNEYDLLFI